jgi:cell division protein FtsW
LLQQLPIDFLNLWFKNTFPLWLITIALLLAVLVVGTEVNGSTRWIRVGGFTLQATEVAKVMMAIFTADYVVRRAEEVRNNIKGLVRLGRYVADGGFNYCRA